MEDLRECQEKLEESKEPEKSLTEVRDIIMGEDNQWFTELFTKKNESKSNPELLAGLTRSKMELL